VSFSHSRLMQLCALKTHIRISRNLKKCVDVMTSHRSGPEPSPCPLQAQAIGQEISRNLVVGCNGSVTPARHVDWLAKLLTVTPSHLFDRGFSNSQSDFISMLCRRLCLPFLHNRQFLEVSNTILTR